METFPAADNSRRSVNTKRKATDSRTGRSKRPRSSASPPTSDAEKSEDSYTRSPETQGISPLTPLTPSSPRKFPSDLKTHHCPYEDCSKSFNRPARLTEHLRSHTNERPFHCKFEDCGKRFLRETHLSHHTKSAHTDERDHICGQDGCGKKFLTATRLRRHYAAHEGREKYRCTQFPPCNETFRKHSTLQKHITSVHLQQKPYPCNLIDEATGKPCSHGFETAGKLRAHEGRTHGGARFWCSECGGGPNKRIETIDSQDQGVGFPTYALLQEHIRNAHPPVCAECSHQCATQRELKQHIEIQHGGQSLEERKSHICTRPSCGRGFTKKGNLLIHMRTVHGGKKQFICGETNLSSSKKLQSWDGVNACGGSFTTKGNLEEHIRTVHLHIPNRNKASRYRKENRTSHNSTTLGPNRTLNQSSTLTRLTGVGYAEGSGRTVTCPEPDCPFRFLRTYDLEVHLRSRHGLTDSDEGLGGHGRMWVGEGYVNEEDEIAEGEVTRQFDVEAELERMAAEGGEFWVGYREEMECEGEWDGQAIEGRIHEEEFSRGDRGREEDAVIDPILR